MRYEFEMKVIFVSVQVIQIWIENEFSIDAFEFHQVTFSRDFSDWKEQEFLSWDQFEMKVIFVIVQAIQIWIENKFMKDAFESS